MGRLHDDPIPTSEKMRNKADKYAAKGDERMAKWCNARADLELQREQKRRNIQHVDNEWDYDPSNDAVVEFLENI